MSSQQNHPLEDSQDWWLQTTLRPRGTKHSSSNIHTTLGDTSFLLRAHQAKSQLLNLGKGESSCVNPKWSSGMGKPKSHLVLAQSRAPDDFPASQAQLGHTHKLPQLLRSSQPCAELVAKCPSHNLHPLSWHHLHRMFFPSPYICFSCPFGVTIYL